MTRDPPRLSDPDSNRQLRRGRNWPAEKTTPAPIVIDNEGTTPADDPRLAEIAAEIRTEHEQGLAAFRRGFDHFLRVGELLRQARAAAGHGRWTAWLLNNTPVSETAARGYIRMAEEFPKLNDENRQRVAGLPWRDALRVIAKKPRDAVSATSAPATAPSERRLKALSEAWHDAEPMERAKFQAEVQNLEVRTSPRVADLAKKRPASRAARWADAAARAIEALEELQDIQGEYESWKESLPENLLGGAMAEKLEAATSVDVVDAIGIATEAQNLDLPRGFGRD